MVFGFILLSAAYDTVINKIRPKIFWLGIFFFFINFFLFAFLKTDGFKNSMLKASGNYDLHVINLELFQDSSFKISNGLSELFRGKFEFKGDSLLLVFNHPLDRSKLKSATYVLRKQVGRCDLLEPLNFCTDVWLEIDSDLYEHQPDR